MSGHILKITMVDTHPPMWRRIVIPEHISFYDLHVIIQSAFGWENEHLHDFRPAQAEFTIGNEDSGGWGEQLSEDSTDVTDYVYNFSSILYTYDFGDDWKHKIVFEKDNPDYQDRFAKILKFKGNNFEEDSGGVWGQDEEENLREAYDLAKENKNLAEMEFSAIKGTKKSQRFVEQSIAGREAGKLMKDLKKYTKQIMAEKPIDNTKAKASAVMSEIEQWKDFYGEKREDDAKNDAGPLNTKEQYEQLTLPGMDIPSEGKTQIKKKYILRFEQSDKNCIDRLKRLDEEKLRDYCKFLRLTPVSSTIAEMAKAIQQELLLHPEFYLYIFPKDDLDYIEMMLKDEGELPLPGEADTGYRLAGLGFVQIVLSDIKNKVVTFSISKDAAVIFEKLTKEIQKDTYALLKKYSKRISYYILSYGMIDLDFFYTKYTEDYNDSIGKEDFLRIIYWHCYTNGFFQTFVEKDTQKRYAISNEIDADAVSQDYREYGKKVDYYPFTRWQLEDWDKGFSYMYGWWENLGVYLQKSTDLEAYVIAKVMTGFYCKAVSGELVNVLYDAFTSAFPPETIGNRIIIWQLLLQMCLHTHMPALKGYTREDYGKITYTNPYKIKLMDEKVLSQDYDEDTRLAKLPLELQQEILDTLNLKDNGRRAKGMEQINKTMKRKNKEVLFLLAECFLDAGKTGRALTTIEKLGDMEPEDASVSYLQEDILESMREPDDMYTPDMSPDFFSLFEEPKQPFVRNTKKIGRNDPCPCGSGKKYKKCCGRNQ